MSGAADPHRYIFICGLHRSGTSLLHRLLGAHPDVSRFENTGVPEDEGQHLQTVYPTAQTFGGAGKFCFDDRSYLTEDSPLFTPENQQKLLAEWSHYWDRNRSVQLEKSPPNIVRTRFLQAMFPDSGFIFLLRHPLAVSYATQKWSKTGIRELVEHWVHAHAAMLEDIQFLERYTLLRYEDFVAGPQDILTRLYEMAGVEPMPLIEPVAPEVNQKYFALWEKDALGSPQLLEGVRKLHEIPNRFGYYFVPPYVRTPPAPAP